MQQLINNLSKTYNNIFGYCYVLESLVVWYENEADIERAIMLYLRYNNGNFDREERKSLTLNCVFTAHSP